MTLNITAGTDGAVFGDFSDKEVRTLILEAAQALYRPAHDVLVSAHAEELRGKPTRGRIAPPIFDDAILAPVWAACLARARAHVADVLGMDLALVASTSSPSQVRDVRGSSPGPIN